MNNAKTGFYFSFSFCILGGCVLFLISLIEHLKGTYGYPDYYGGSKLDLCKTDTNMTFEMNGGPPSSGGHFRGCAGVGESASALFGEPPDGQLVLMPAPNGHLKCTCLPSNSELKLSKKSIFAGQKRIFFYIFKSPFFDIFKSTKTHFLPFQKWEKIHFCTKTMY